MIKTRYAEQPYQKVRILEMKIDGMKNNADAQYIQYKLLLNGGVIIARINFPTKKGVIVIRDDVKPDSIVEYINNLETYDGNGSYNVMIEAEKITGYDDAVLSKTYRL